MFGKVEYSVALTGELAQNLLVVVLIFLVIWFLAPEIARWVSRPVRPRTESLRADDRKKLQEFVAASPTDSFVRYGLAQEYLNQGEGAQAVEQFRELLVAIQFGYNKKTMQAAEVLYGITMEEPGVSKVVSVRMS